MRKFRVIDGSNDGSLAAAPLAEATAEATAEPASPGDAPAQPPPAAAGDGADGLVTASTGYDAALQTTKKIRQRSLLDFLR
jgi:hypothetical protein